MKKIYLLAFTLGAFVFSASAQVIIDDNMEDYSLGPLFEDHWSNWSNADGPENIIVVNTFANSGSQSGLIGDDGVQDAVLKLGNRTSGQFTVSWYMYVPGGKTAYYNYQENEVPGAGAWGLNVHFNYQLGSPGMGLVVDDANPGNVVAQFNYPENFWFKITHQIDLDADTVIMDIDGTEIYNGPFYTLGLLGGVDFYSLMTDSDNTYYVDDAYFAQGTVGVEDFTADNFSVYPNPVRDFLNISTKTAVDQVAVYDILGKVVLTSQPGTISPKVDMSALSSGAYLVKVTIGNSSKTIKVIK